MLHILRHFKVQDDSKQWLNSQEFDSWVEEYDTLTLQYFDINLPQNIDKVYVSSQKRAVKTSNFLGLKYETSDLLVEVGVEAFIDTQLRFPKWFWLFIGRILWYFGLTSCETKNMTNQRMETFISQIDFDKNILIVSHGFFMVQLMKKLKTLGYGSDIKINIKNGKFYTLSFDTKRLG